MSLSLCALFERFPFLQPLARSSPNLSRKARIAADLLTKDVKLFVRLMRGSSSRMTVFGLDTSGDWQPSISIPDARIESLDDERLLSLPASAGDPEFTARQRDRLQRFGRSYAWGVYIGGDLAHVSWLLPAAAVALDKPRILTLEEDEAEITACETLTGFRGKGVYGYAIQQLSAIARDQGVRRVCMKVADSNMSSLKGARKAGMRPIGFVRLITPPLRPSKLLVREHLAWR